MTTNIEKVAKAIRYELEKSTVRGNKYENAAQAAIEAMQPDWQDISTAPRDRKILLMQQGQIIEGFWHEYWNRGELVKEGWLSTWGAEWLYDVQSWQPLPQPPKERA